MAAGFAMLEAGQVRAKNTTEILTKNVELYATSTIMYLACGYAIMYGGTFFLKGIGQVDVNETLKSFAGREDGFTGKSIYSGASDFFFQVVFAATCYVEHIGCGSGAYEALGDPAVLAGNGWLYVPDGRFMDQGSRGCVRVES